MIKPTETESIHKRISVDIPLSVYNNVNVLAIKNGMAPDRVIAWIVSNYFIEHGFYDKDPTKKVIDK